LRTVHADDHQRVLIRHEREHVADLQVDWCGRRGGVGNLAVAHRTGEVEVHINSILFQHVHSRICLQIGTVRFLCVSSKRIDGHGGLSDHGVVISVLQRHIRIHGGFDCGIFNVGQSDRDVATGLADHLVITTAKGAQAQHHLTKRVVVSVSMVNDHRVAFCIFEDGGQVFIGTRVSGLFGWIGVAVSADDRIHPASGHRQVGIHIGVHLHATRIFSETNMGQSDHHIIGGVEQVSQFLGFGDRICKGESWNVAG